MKRNINRIKLSVILLTLVFLALSTTVYAINNMDTTNPVKDLTMQQSEELTVEFAKQFDKKPDDIKKLKTEVKEWKKVYMELVKEKRQHKKLSKSDKENLMIDGYQAMDMEKAEQLAVFSNKSAKEILQLRGKKPGHTIKIETNKDGVQKSIVTDHTADLWDPVITKLGIDLKQVAENLGVLPEDIKKMIKEGISPREIYEITQLSIAFSHDYNDVWNDLSKGATLEQLQVNYIRELKGKAPLHEKTEVDAKSQQDLIIKNAFNLSDEEISLFNQSGITEYIDMGQAKHLAAKHKVTLKKVLDSKKNRSWDQVSTELGGNKR
jgi:fructose-specific phosphotransferase system component IIB